MVAFALRAIKDYQKLKPSDKEWNASREWLMSNDTESPLSFIQIMEVVEIDAASCIGCSLCAQVCPTDCIQPVDV